MKTKNALLRVLKNSSDVEATKWLYHVGLNMATSFLRYRMNTGLLDLRFLNLDAEYVASTAVCELFARDEENQFKVLSGCALMQQLGAHDDAYAEIQFKRMVITKVRDTLFLLFKHHDRSLSNIIRNVKSALTEREYLKLDAHGYLYIENASATEPPLSDDILDYLLYRCTKTSDSISGIVEAFEQQVLAHGNGALHIALTEFSVLIRSFTIQQAGMVETPDQTMNYLMQHDLEHVVSASIQKVESEYYDRYVENRKLPPELYTIYIASIKDMYLTLLKNGNSAEDSIVYYLKHYLPELDSETYRDSHRRIVEYLIRVSKKQIKSDYRIYF